MTLEPAAEQFLHGRHIASLATFNPEGSIHLAAVWYLWDRAARTLSVPTGSGTRKARNAAARNEASIMIDSRAHGRFRGIAAVGHVRVIGGEEAKERNAAIHHRYITPEGMAHPEFGVPHSEADDATIVLTLERARWWAMADIFDADLESRCLYPLDE